MECKIGMGYRKLSGRPKGDHVTNFWSWIQKHITWSSVFKCSYAKDIIEKGPMMWMSSTMEENRQKGKWLIVKFKALKWTKANIALPKDHLNEFPWQMDWL